MFIQGGQTKRPDQAHRLRQWVSQVGPARARTSAQTHVIAVVSGKGGVGKTLVAVNLSIALAARGHRVILFDGDMGLANADIVLGVNAVWTWRDVLSGRRDLDEVVVQAPGQVALVPGASGVAHLADLSEFERHQLTGAIRQIEDRYEVMVLDCGAGISRNVLSLTGWADTILVVATPEPTALADAYAMIKTLAAEAGRAGARGASIGVMVNLAESRKEGLDTFERLSEVSARFLHLPVTDDGYVLRDDHVPAAVRQRCPVVLRYPRCAASTCLMASAGRLAREMGQPQADRSLFYRVMNMFL